MMHMRVQLANDYSLIVPKLHKIVDNAIGCERAIRVGLCIFNLSIIRFHSICCRLSNDWMHFQIRYRKKERKTNTEEDMNPIGP